MLSTLPVVILGLAARLVEAQTSGVPVCTASGFSWATNSDGASPCSVAVSLAGVCTNGLFQLPPISAGLQYLGPNTTQVSPCRCSTVFYSTLSACAACQGAAFLPWSTYSANCSTVFVSTFQGPLPPTLKVPHWAYLNVTQGNSFNVTAAMAAGGVESSAVPNPSQTAPPGSTSQPPANNGGGSGVNGGAIAGGVVGGIAFLAIVAGVVFWFLRKQRLAREKKSSPYDPMQGNSMSYAPTFISTSVPTPKPYDPNDPSTFPTNDLGGYGTSYPPTPPPDSLRQNQVAPHFTGTTQHSQFTTPGRPHYTGAPEL